MNTENPSEGQRTDVAKMEFKDRKGISLVWLLPIVAILITGWLGYKAYAEKGPTITISFRDGAGVEAGKTKIKYRDIEIGTIRDVVLSDNLAEVVVTAGFGIEAKKHLNKGTRFWVVRPRIGASGVSGLDTLFSGAYIEIEPGDGPQQKHFVGLEQPPLVATGISGHTFELHATSVGSLHAGAPIYYKGIRAGEILGYKFAPDADRITFRAFVEAPFDKLVKQNTRFWNISGVELQAGTDGIDIKTGSLQSILAGGVAFDTFGDQTVETNAAATDITYRLYERYSDTSEEIFDKKIAYVLFFNGTVRGLSAGAPVEFRGIKLGEVTNIHIVEDASTVELYIPVTVELEPERIPYLHGTHSGKTAEEVINELVARGLKGQLKTGNLLTGQLYIDLEFHPAAESKLAGIDYSHPELPTIPTTIEEIKETITRLAADIQGLPLKAIANNILTTTEGLSVLINDPETKSIVHSANATLANADLTLGSMTKTLNTVDDVIAPDSALQYDLANMIVEFKAAAQSFRVLTSYLERHPESLISGKK